MTTTATNPKTGEVLYLDEQSNTWRPSPGPGAAPAKIDTPFSVMGDMGRGIAKSLPGALESGGYETLGGTLGGMGGAGLGPFGALGGATLGTMAGAQVDRMAKMLRGDEPPTQMQAVQAGLAGPALGRLGSLAGGGARYALHPASNATMRGAIPRLDMFQELGIPPLLPAVTGRATDKALWQQGVSRFPVAADIAQEYGERTGAALQGSLRQISGGGAGGRYPAGRAVQEGAAETVDKFFNRAKVFRGEYLKQVPDDLNVDVSEYARTLHGPMGTYGPEQAAAYGNTKFIQRWEALKKRYAIEDPTTGEFLGLEPVPWKEADAIRQAIGDDIGKARKIGTFQDMSSQDLDRAYWAITSDMEQGLGEAAPKALEAWEKHKKFFRRGAKKIKDDIDWILKSKKPEQFNDAIWQGNYSTARRIWGAIPADKRDIVRNEVVWRMGIAPKGAQDASGEVFSTSSFLTNYNRFDGKTRNLLFGRDKGLKRDLESLAVVTDALKDVQQVTNWSNTASANMSLKLLDRAGGVGALALLYFEPTAAGLLGGGTLGARQVAKKMTDPAFIRWVAEGRKFSISELGAGSHIARLTGLTGIAESDEELEGLQNWLSSQLKRPVLRMPDQSAVPPSGPKSASLSTGP